MKALFLDIDGVVNSKETLIRNYRKNGKGTSLGIDPELAFIVGKIIIHTDCKLVISSSWRNHPDSIETIKQQVYPDIYGTTPNLRSTYDDNGRDVTRGSEVAKYLLEHPEITKYAILDDDGDFLDDQPLFKTTWAKGINQDIADEVERYLNS